MMKRTTLIVALVGVSITAYAQNLVPNPSFEVVEKKVKTKGSLELAAPWQTATMNPIDLYVAGTKNEEIAAPENTRGAEKARTGGNYVGVNFFGYRGKAPRTYLTTKLTNPLVGGKEYCFKYHVSLSDKSKYAVNNLAMLVSKEEIKGKTDGKLDYTPQIIGMTNKVYEQQFLWKPVCRIYKAEGGEQYIAIGNFASDENTTQQRVKMSREFTGSQTYDAYYYLDDVSVSEVTAANRKKCLCDVIAGGEMKVETKSFNTEESLRSSAKTTYIVNSDGSRAGEAKEKIEKSYSVANEIILFDSKSYTVKENNTEVLKRIADYLKANPEVKVLISGHSDKSEEEVKMLAKKRAYKVDSKLREMGVSVSQLSNESKGSELPSADGDKTKNSRVSFSIQ